MRILVFYLIFFSVFWLGIKIILISQGFRFTLIWGFKDFEYLHQLVRRETDASRRAFFRGLLFFPLHPDCAVSDFAFGTLPFRAMNWSNQAMQPTAKAYVHYLC
jgi:hypothetical protein